MSDIDGSSPGNANVRTPARRGERAAQAEARTEPDLRLAPSPLIRGVLSAIWALFAGYALIMLGHGLQGTLLGFRASYEGFSTAATGVVMSCFYVGFLAGATWAPRAIGRVGHIRAFGALAALACVAALAHALFVHPLVWGAMRLVSGLAISGMTVVAESWLNDRAPNEMRGRVLSLYQLVVYSALMSGQLLMNVADPGGFELFSLVAILFCLALLPMLLSASPSPSFAAPAPLGLGRLYRISPLGVLGIFATGMSNGAFFTMGAVYGRGTGLSVDEISLFMGAFFLGAIATQFPLGRLSDRLDRRKVLTGVTFGAAAVAAFGVIAIERLPLTSLYAVSFLLGGLSLPMYSLGIAHSNDHVRSEERVAASSGLVLANGLGSIIGPVSAAALMSAGGPAGLFWYLVAVHAGLGAFALYRMRRRAPVLLEEQGISLPLPASASPIAAAQLAESSRPPSAGSDEPAPPRRSPGS